jgi:hypothetical protein
MPVTPQHSLLSRLLDYVVEQGKEIDLRAYTLSGATEFRRFPRDLAALPGVELDRKIEGDHIWLQVQRLEAKPAPKVSDESLRTFIAIVDDPAGPPPAANETALKHRAATALRTHGEKQAQQQAAELRAQVDAAVAQYSPLWSAWAEGEKPRRRTISLYGDLFMLKGRLEAEESALPSELVWGVGVAAWRFAGTLTDNGSGNTVSVDYQYPMLTQVVEIDLDPQTHTISVRPRAVPPRLELSV